KTAPARRPIRSVTEGHGTTTPRRRDRQGVAIWAESGSGNLDDVLGLYALRAFDHVEADAIAFGQGTEALGDDRGVVDEDVRAALPNDESITLGVVEPLHDTLLRHTLAPYNNETGLLFLPR